jgi:hypothetical protein
VKPRRAEVAEQPATCSRPTASAAPIAAYYERVETASDHNSLLLEFDRYGHCSCLGYVCETSTDTVTVAVLVIFRLQTTVTVVILIFRIQATVTDVIVAILRLQATVTLVIVVTFKLQATVTVVVVVVFRIYVVTVVMVVTFRLQATVTAVIVVIFRFQATVSIVVVVIFIGFLLVMIQFIILKNLHPYVQSSRVKQYAFAVPFPTSFFFSFYLSIVLVIRSQFLVNYNHPFPVATVLLAEEYGTKLHAKNCIIFKTLGLMFIVTATRS